MTRPLLSLAGAFICGILTEYARYRMCSESTLVSWWLLLAYGISWSLAYLCHRFHKLPLASGGLLVTAFFAGMLRYSVSTDLPAHHISHWITNEIVTIEGVLYRPPEDTGPGRNLYLETQYFEKSASRFRTTGKILITLTTPLPDGFPEKQLTYGTRIRARLRLTSPRQSDTFDYQEFLRRRGIYLVGKLRHERYLLILEQQQGNRFLHWIYGIQAQIISFFDSYIGELASQTTNSSLSSVYAIQIIKAMTLGTGRGLSPALQETFRKAGMYHFLVVSGIHVAIVSWLFHLLLQGLGIPTRFRFFFLGAVLLTYAGLTGFQFPVLRAVIMACVLYFSWTCNRTTDPAYSLAFSVAVITLCVPNSLFEVSFRLTTAATASILLAVRLIQHMRWNEKLARFHRITQGAVMSVLTTIGAMAGVSPLMIYYFGQWYPSSLLSNPLALPLVSILLSLSLLLNLCGVLLQGWSGLFPLLSIDIMLAQKLIAFAEYFPDWNITLPQPPGSIILGYYGVMGYFLLHRYRKRKLAILIPAVDDMDK